MGRHTKKTSANAVRACVRACAKQKAMVLLCDVPVHELTAGDKQLLQPSRNWPMHQAQCYAHQKCGLKLESCRRYLLLGKNVRGGPSHPAPSLEKNEWNQLPAPYS